MNFVSLNFSYLRIFNLPLFGHLFATIIEIDILYIYTTIYVQGILFHLHVQSIYLIIQTSQNIILLIKY